MQDNQLTKTRLTTQLWIGVLCAALEFGLYFLYQNIFNPLPLYMDTLFTTAASFFGPISGCICAFLFHAISIFIFKYPLYNFAWSICSFSVVLIIRLYVSIRKKSIGKKLEVLDIVLLVFIVALIISIEGALIFTTLNFIVNYTEDSQVRFMFAFLSQNNVSTFISALLPRVPVNILDKGICVTLGYFAFKGMKKLFNRKR
ncbi:MAG: hypothetical protein J5647_00700 [Spirochaetaceae bacterium]|jgi:uncharacterized membrane protein|nr:hypothetical protein [Spirochaetaceae bacterium]